MSTDELSVERQRRIAVERRAMAIKVATDRAERIDHFMAEYTATPASTPRDRAGSARAKKLAVLAEGDSWFDYPIPFTGGGIIDHLSDLYDLPILNLAHYGDETRQMMSLKQRTRLERILDPRQSGVTWEALLFSGGGNDFVGDQFCLWLNHRKPNSTWQDALRTDRIDQVTGLVENSYRELLDLRDRLAPQCKVFVHGYDFPFPSDEGVCGVGPWLRPSLIYRKWIDESDQAAIAQRLLEGFGDLMQRLEQEHAGTFIYVRTHRVLDRSMWSNEIHPSRAGFKELAAKFGEALEQHFPGRM